MKTALIKSIDLLAYKQSLKVKSGSDHTLIWDILHKKYLVFTPEEMVRQLCLLFLIEAMKYPKAKFNGERQLVINGRKYRYDLLLYAPDFSPFLLVECKAPGVKLSNLTFEQISNYNKALHVPYLLITNGPDIHCVSIDWTNKSFTFLEALPSYPEI